MKRSELLNELQEEERQREVFLDQIGPVCISLAGVAGHWSVKDIVAHFHEEHEPDMHVWLATVESNDTTSKKGN